MGRRFRLLLLLVVTAPFSVVAAQRTTIPLDGLWQIEDSKDPDAIPTTWKHTVPVPGLAHSATPPFPNVDLFDSRMVIQNRVSQGKLPKNALVSNAGVSRQDRNFFWYRHTFNISELHSVAVLRIKKAQFGATVWINGVKIGEHLPCFSAAIIDVSKAIRRGENELIVRVGAHPGVLPPSVSGGTDFEKIRWTPGIYDDVSLSLSENPAIESVQVAPRIADRSITVQTLLNNRSERSVSFQLSQAVHPWKEQAVIARTDPLNLVLAPGENKTVTQIIPVPGAQLWSPESPNLYVLETATGGDSASTRFGMREFRFDTATKRAYLNGHVYFMRGSNITLHRFFEDPLSGTLPWDENWVRKLLVDIPHQMHWNSFRLCIGPVPDRWLDIADEAGLLIQNEYFVWTGHDWHGPENQVHFDTDEMIHEYSEWMRDNWNHPSVAIWDANNETWDSAFGEKIIPAVRGLDLSDRPWENSYNPPEGPNDPVEDHPYEHQEMAAGGPALDMTKLEYSNSVAPGAPSAHALILNEYGWLWLNRDGSPTELTKKLYPALLGPKSTAAERLALNAYLLAGLTEYWRAYRMYAGVLHFVYLTSSDPVGYTSDHFRDVKNLELHSEFRDYMSNAFAPVGVYLSFWQPSVAAGSFTSLRTMLVNDEEHEVEGSLTLALENSKGERVVSQKRSFTVAALGQTTINQDFQFPHATGEFLLHAIIEHNENGNTVSTQSRRHLKIVAAEKEN
ncbi:MAG TPA: glycoside hydrolase family 2 TIM barrel-domain containing protein [Candidatus Solibacter sp.]|nr:glycoside hydrolase family 2 TIM barrel-domain containing protein [Candidatus Solibacter sp.]